MKNSGYIGYQLRELYASGEIASIFTDPQNPDDFVAGYVRGINARSVLVESITPYGRFDGWLAIRLSSIIEVMYDITYAGRLELLLKIQGECSAALFGQSEEDYVVLILRHVQKHHRVVTIWNAEEAFTGYVTAVDDLRCTIESLDFMGEKLGANPVRLTDIEFLSFGSEEERMNETLSEHLDSQRDEPPEE